jgi:cysteine desulfurase
MATQLPRGSVTLTLLKPDQHGVLTPDALRAALSAAAVTLGGGSVALVSVAHANNEIGTVQDISTLASIAKAAGAIMHVDACQSFTKIPLDTSRVPVDLVTINAHKIHGPKGVGALYIRKGVVLEPMARGGSQEWNLRAGTSNVPGVVGFAEAVRLAQQSASLGGVSHMRALCTRLMRALQLRLGEDAIQLNGPPIGDGRLCSNLSLQFKGIEGDALLRYCARRGLCCSSASACHADVDVPSHVLLAIGCSTKQAKATLRLTTCRFTTETEIDHAADILADFRAQQQPLR